MIDFDAWIKILIAGYFVSSLFSFSLAGSIREKRSLAPVMIALLFTAIHGSLLVQRGLQAGRLPFINTYETLVLFSFFIMVIYLIIFFRYRLLFLGGSLGMIAVLMLAVTSLLVPDIEPLMPSLKSNWLLFHVILAFLGYSFFAGAFGCALFYLFLFFRQSRGQTAREDREDQITLLDQVDWLTYRLIGIGYPFLTMGIMTGAVWANASWGRYWNWDPKETSAFVAWLIYTICIHARNAQEVRGAKAALLAIAGFAAIMFTYFGVNFGLPSLHAYS